MKVVMRYTFLIAITFGVLFFLGGSAVAFASPELPAASMSVFAEESEDPQGVGLLIIMIGLTAVLVTGGYYLMREYGLSKNNKDK